MSKTDKFDFIDGRGRPPRYSESKEKMFARTLKKKKGNAAEALRHLRKRGYEMTIPTLIRIGRKYGVEPRKRGRPCL